MGQPVGGTRGRSARRVVVALGAVALVATLVVVSLRSRTAGPVDAEFARLRAEGLPATCAEAFGCEFPPSATTPAMVDGPRGDPGSSATTDDDNGVADVEAAFARLEAMCGKWGTWRVTGPWDADASDPWETSATAEQRTALRAFLDRARPFYDAVDVGLAKPVYRFAPTLDADGLPTLDHVTLQQRLIQLFSCRAAAAAEPQDRIAGMASAARLSRRIEPRSVLAVMVALASRAVALRESRRAAEDGTIPAADLRRALDAEFAVSALPLLPAAARSEAAWIGTAWRAAQSGAAAATRPRRSGIRRVLRGLERLFDGSDDVSFDELSADEMAAVMRFWAAATKIDASSPDALRESIDALVRSGAGDRSGTVAVLRQMERRVLRAEAAARLARVALAAKAHREATGAWPATLDELAPALGGVVPTDPATGRAFEFESVEGRFVLRAAGEQETGDSMRREMLLLWEFPR